MDKIKNEIEKKAKELFSNPDLQNAYMEGAALALKLYDKLVDELKIESFEN